MSTNVFHFVVAVGESSEELVRACDALRLRRRSASPGQFGSDDWSESDRTALDTLVYQVLDVVHRLPIIHYSSFLNAWEGPDLLGRFTDWPDDVRREILGNRYNLTYYPSEFSDVFVRQVDQVRNLEQFRDLPGVRQFLGHLREALVAPNWLESSSVVLAVCDSLGPTRLDEEIRASLTTRLDITVE